MHEELAMPDDGHDMNRFERWFHRSFPGTSFRTLSTSPQPRLRFEMGGECEGAIRHERVVTRALRILDHLFRGGSIWLRIECWGESGPNTVEPCMNDLQQCGFRDDADCRLSLLEEDSYILLLFWRRYRPDIVEPIVRAIAGFELGIMPSANVRCYFVSFDDDPAVANLYDDRGMDVVASRREGLDDLAQMFRSYLLERVTTMSLTDADRGKVVAWIHRAIEGGTWRSFDDLHVDEINVKYRETSLWLPAAMAAFQEAIGLRDRMFPAFHLELHIPLQAEASPFQPPHGSYWDLERELMRTPPSLYLFRSDWERWEEVIGKGHIIRLSDMPIESVESRYFESHDVHGDSRSVILISRSLTSVDH